MQKLMNNLPMAPWWAYIILIYLIYVGVKGTKTRTLWLPKIFIAPVIFIGLSLANVLGSYGANVTAWALYLAAILVAIVLGWLTVSRTALAFDKAKVLITLPGTYVNLILFLCIFTIKFYFGYREATQLDLRQDVSWMVYKVGISGLITGLMLGRNLAYLHKYLKA